MQLLKITSIWNCIPCSVYFVNSVYTHVILTCIERSLELTHGSLFSQKIARVRIAAYMAVLHYCAIGYGSRTWSEPFVFSTTGTHIIVIDTPPHPCTHIIMHYNNYFNAEK